MIGALLPKGKTQFLDGSGRPLAAGSVTFYVAGTGVLATTWQDSALTVANTNPILLDSAGEAAIWGLGKYTMVVADASGAQLWSVDTFAAPPELVLHDSGTTNALAVAFPGLSGTALAQPLDQLVGCLLMVVPANTNTGPATLAVSGQPPVEVTYAEGTSLAGGELPAGAQIPLVWNGARMQLFVTSPAGFVLPAGSVVDFAGDSAQVPVGWLLCAGQAVSRTTYAKLFAAIGTLWGPGNGSSTFNVPDLRGRATFGADAMGGTAAGRLTSASLGATAGVGAAGGSEATQAHGHAPTVTDPGHTHVQQLGQGQGGSYAGWSIVQSPNLDTQNSTQSAKTGITVAVADYGTGGSENLPPAGVTNKIIFVGAG